MAKKIFFVFNANIMRINSINNISIHKNLTQKSFKGSENKTIEDCSQNELPMIYGCGLGEIKASNYLKARTQPDMKDFFEFLDKLEVNGTSLTKQITDFKFAFNPDFDKQAWTNFLCEMDESVAVMESTDEEKTFLSLLNEICPISDLLNSAEFKPDKLIEFLDEYYERSDEDISEFPLSMQLSFAVDVASSNKNVAEYIQDMFYFQRLKDKSDNIIFTDLATLKYMLNVDKGSVEASNAQMLLELVQNGVVGKHVFDYVPEKGAKISSFVVEDIDKLYSAYINGIEPIDEFVPTFQNKEDALSSLKIGDVYELDGEENIFLIDKNGLPIQLKIDKETYFELFPPIERYAATQNDIGNCWEVTAFNTLLCDPKEKASVLTLFRKENDDIVIAFPYKHAGDIRFKNGELPENATLKYYSKGPKGIRLFEYAHGYEEHEYLIQLGFDMFNYSIGAAKAEEEKQILQENLEIFNELLAENRDNVVIEHCKQKKQWCFGPWDKYENGFDNAVTLTRNGGDPVQLFMDLLYSTENIAYDENEVYSLISNPKNFEDYIITFGTNQHFVPKNSPLLKDHSYRLYPAKIDVNGKNSEFKLIDPAGIIEIPITTDELIEHDGMYSIARRNKSYR